jgi:hypothetical protein
LPAGYILGVGSLPITLVRGAPNGTEALQKRLRRGLQHSAIDGFQVCRRLAKHLLVKSVARCLGVGKPGIISGRQRINWPQAIETLELHLIYSYQNVQVSFRFETMPSSPSLQACRTPLSPSSSMSSFSRTPCQPGQYHRQGSFAALQRIAAQVSAQNTAQKGITAGLKRMIFTTRLRAACNICSYSRVSCLL